MRFWEWYILLSPVNFVALTTEPLTLVPFIVSTILAVVNFVLDDGSEES